MPREVFADEIERFLETLDGVSSARVLSGSGGDISYVYVTTEGAHEGRRVRHGVLAALQSRFGIPVDDWRVRVTQLRAGVQPNEIPQFCVARVEETATAAEIAVTVKLEWTRGSDRRSATGQARGRGGPAQRPRTLAAAAIAAVRDALDVPHADLALDRVGVVTFLDRPVVLVAVSAGAAGEPETYVGAAFDDAAAPAAGVAPDETAEPVIAATLDAVTRWLLRAAFVDDVPRLPRRERLEAMRHFVLDAAEPGVRHETASRITPVHALPPRHPGGPRNGQSRVDQAMPARESDPGHGGAAAPMSSLTRGGSAMGLQHDTPDVGSGMRAGRAAGVEDGFYRSLVVERTPVHLRCRDGYEVPRAVVRDAGTYALLVETPDGLELFFKHAIISIRVLPKPAAQA
jgi:sRNA-binding regulator protein Hfq